MKWVAVTGVVLLLAGLAWWQIDTHDPGHIREELVLNVPDTSKIWQLKILDRNGQNIVLTRKSSYWLVNGEKARKHAVDNLLSTLYDQRVSALIPNAAMENVVKDLGSNSVRITVLNEKQNPMMVFYVGGVTPDERGTFMLREGSEWPVIVNIPGFEGGLRSRYIMPLKDWKSRQIIQPIEDIRSLMLEYPTKQEHSFLLQKIEGQYHVTPLYQTDVDSVTVHPYLVEAYLDQINHLYAEAILDGNKREALEGSTPFCRLKIKGADGKVQKLEFYPTTWIDYIEQGERPQHVERYYTDYNDKTIFLTQHLLMQKIFTGYEHFVSLKDFDKKI